jgi:two-component system alkaline phosphatase synthesis response regulator PhoP
LDVMRTGEMRVLVVEDDPSIRRLVQWTLQDEGLPVDAVGDGAEAIRYLGDRCPALLILDVMMPRADGYRVSEALRSIHGRETPILILTAAGNAREAARRIGAADYLAKPFELAEMVALVRRLLGQSHLSLVDADADECYLDTAAG